jgi:phosphate/sulfate permease
VLKIKNGIIDIDRFTGNPGALMLAMTCAEVGSATWLMVATSLGMPVSTTQTIVGALIGAGFASQANITWRWTSGSVSQIAASWGVAPGIAAGFSAIIFATLKWGILERKDSLKWAFRLIPFYIAGTALILAVFLAVESTDGFDALSNGELAGMIIAIVSFVMLG